MMIATKESRGRILTVLRHLAIIVVGIAIGMAAIALVIVFRGGTLLSLCILVPFLLVGSGWLLLVRSEKHPEQHVWKRPLGLSIWAGMLLALVVYGIMVYFSFDTLYAPGYSEEAFRSVQVGDTKEDVLERLGEPLRVLQFDGVDGEVLSYSESPSGSNYLMRDIVLDAESRVIEIRSEIYWD